MSTVARKTDKPNRRSDVPRQQKELDPKDAELATLFGVHLRELLAKKRLTAKTFHEALQAEGVELGLSTINRWIRGDGFPNTPVLIPMAKVLGLSDYRKILPPLD